MLRRTLYTVVPALALMVLVTIFIYRWQMRDAPDSVGLKVDPDQATYDRIMRVGGFMQLDAADLRDMLDMTFYGIKNEWVIYYGANGEVKFSSTWYKFSDGTYTDRGYREITDDGRACTKWRKLREGLRRCGRVWRKSVPGKEDLYYGMLRHGWIGSKFTVRSGNVEGL